jgi:acyl-CoA synthetase (AMP-forming)/AMP-acid ligase II
MPEFFNIAQYLPQRAAESPTRPAVICPHAPDKLGRTTLTFAELNSESDTIARGLQAIGVHRGCRTLLIVRPGLDFVTLTFALFKAGALPVLIDPGMGKRNLLNCIRQVRPEAVVAVPLVHAVRIFMGSDAFDAVRVNVTVGRRWFWGGFTLDHVRQIGQSAQPFEMASTTRETDAAIVFTTGSTGIPKGVVYKHGMFDAQVQMIRQEYGIEPGEVDLPAFPLFALFSTALGTTCAIPDMDPTRPAQADPRKIVDAIRRHGVTYTFGSPSIWKRVGPYCIENGIRLPSLKRILMAGAPVKGSVLAPFAKVLERDADVFIPYGATEALPVCSIRGSEVVNETWAMTRQGKGYCVGRPLLGVTVRIVKDSQETEWDESLVLPQGEIGEIVVKSAAVTHEYFNMPEQTRAAKIYEAAGSDPHASSQSSIVWHRMGDMGYLDEKGRLWFCGRKAHRVLAKNGKVHYSVCAEAIFEEAIARALPAQSPPPRAALVGVGRPGEQTPYLLLECVGDAAHVKALEDALGVWQREHPLAREIKALRYPLPFPVDVRHNAKINREELARWAEKQKS